MTLVTLLLLVTSHVPAKARCVPSSHLVLCGTAIVCDLRMMCEEDNAEGGTDLIPTPSMLFDCQGHSKGKACSGKTHTVAQTALGNPSVGVAASIKCNLTLFQLPHWVTLSDSNTPIQQSFATQGWLENRITKPSTQ